MPQYEYKIVPAPNRGLKGKGIKGPEARFANALEGKMNEMAADGWEYQRAETLPSVERSGLTSTTTEWRNVLVFRRLRENAAEAAKPELLPPPAAQAEPDEKSNDQPDAKVEKTAEASEEPAKSDTSEKVSEPTFKTAARKDDAADNGVEDTGDVSVIGSSLGKLAEARKLSKSES